MASRTGTGKFGWCLDGHHEGCKYLINTTDGAKCCTCECHASKD